MHKMSFEVKRHEPAARAEAPSWMAALLIATVATLAWALEPTLIRALMH
jgi:hypothetical protein